MTIHESITFYQSGQCRNNEHALTHTYADVGGELYPMCGYGWNRSNGNAFSIFRNSIFSEGACKLCRKNLADGKPPVINHFTHKTKWS